MVSKNIRISQDVWDDLYCNKQNNESFSKIIRRLIDDVIKLSQDHENNKQEDIHNGIAE